MSDTDRESSSSSTSTENDSFDEDEDRRTRLQPAQHYPPRPGTLGTSWYAHTTTAESRFLHDIHGGREEIRELTTKIRRAKESVKTLEQHLFATRALRAPVARVPDDVLRLIFESRAESLSSFGSAESDDGSSSHFGEIDHVPFQVICSHVCSRWRRVALEDVALWTRFVIQNQSTLDFATAITETRTNTAYLHLDISCPLIHSVSSGHHLLYQSLLSYLTHHARRIAGFRLTGSKADTTTLLSDIAGFFSDLKAFRIRWETYGEDDAPSAVTSLVTNVLRPASGLRRVQLAGYEALPQNNSRLESVMFLELHGLHANTKSLLDFLISFPNLRQLCLHRLQKEVEPKDAIIPPVTRLQYLAGLSFHELPEEFFPALLLLDMPNLEHLVIDTMTSWGDVVSYGKKDDPRLITLLSKHPSVSSLSLRMDTPDTFFVLGELGLALENEASFLLPRLSHLRVCSPAWTNSLPPRASSHRLIPADRSVLSNRTVLSSRPASSNRAVSSDTRGVAPRKQLATKAIRKSSGRVFPLPKPPRPTTFDTYIQKQLLALIQERSTSGYALHQLRICPPVGLKYAVKFQGLVNFECDLRHVA